MGHVSALFFFTGLRFVLTALLSSLCALLFVLFAILIEWRPADLAIFGNMVLVYSKYDAIASVSSDFSSLAPMAVADDMLVFVLTVIVGVDFPANFLTLKLCV